MRAILITIALALLIPQVAIAAGKLNPVPIPSEPCRTVSTPNGEMCVSQQILKVYGGVIRTQRESNAKRICFDRGGNQLIPTVNRNEWLCVREISVG